MLVLVFSTLLVGLVGVWSADTELPIIHVKQGAVNATIERLRDGTSYFSFKGIPYAEPPVGDLRFQAPRPPKKWSGILIADKHGPNCPQFDTNVNQFVEGSEDCLYLNVYSKTLKSKLPVMVYIHGGGFMSGSGDTDTYGPDFLIQHDVILVTINYRLEVLGFLCLDIPEAPGNAGMKDQAAALKWVKENIAKFGGDPDNITIFGESAGSAAVTLHMFSPMSKGLFNKAIAQSGVCIQDWANTTDATARAFRVGKVLGKDTNDPKELLAFLKTLPAIKLTRLTFKTRTEDERYRGLPVHFVPVVEKKFAGVKAFIDEDPMNLIMSSKDKIPLMIGYNSAEGLLMLQDQLNKTERMNANPSYYVPKEMVSKISSTKLKEFGDRIKRFYVKDKDFGNETAQGLIDLHTDLHFAYNTHRFVHLYNNLDAAVYMYRFDYSTDLNVLKTFLGVTEYPGACHADDLFYLFNNELNKDAYDNQERLRSIVFDLTKLWTDFAKTGNPTPKNKSSVQWKRFTASRRDYLNLNEVMTPSRNADRERMDFWNNLYCEVGLPCIKKCNI